VRKLSNRETGTEGEVGRGGGGMDRKDR